MTLQASEFELLEDALCAAAAELGELTKASDAGRRELALLLAESRDKLAAAQARVAELENARARDAVATHERLSALIETRSTSMRELLTAVEQTADFIRKERDKAKSDDAKRSAAEQDLKLARDELAETRQVLDDLTRTHAQATSELQTMRFRLSALELELEQARTENAAQRDEGEDVREALVTAMSERDGIKKELETARIGAERGATVLEKDHLDALAERDRELKILEAQLAEARAEASAAKSRIADHIAELTDARDEGRSMELSLAKHVAELAEAHNKTARSEARVAEQTAELEQVRAELAQVRAELATLHESRASQAELQEELNTARATLSDLTSRLVHPTNPPPPGEIEAAMVRMRQPTPQPRRNTGPARSLTAYSMPGSEIPTERLGSQPPPARSLTGKDRRRRGS